jgi:hypothetical protein
MNKIEKRIARGISLPLAPMNKTQFICFLVTFALVVIRVEVRAIRFPSPLILGDVLFSSSVPPRLFHSKGDLIRLRYFQFSVR